MQSKTGEKQAILLESGTNEFEIVEFTVGDTYYGINVAKVREVINLLPVTAMPQVHPYVDGVFTLRDRVMPLVNLPRCLGKEGAEARNIIVSELNNFYAGFLVSGVTRIHRISWSEMEPAPLISNTSLVIGIVKMKDKIVILLDFEKIISEINPDMNKKLSTIPETIPETSKMRSQKTVMIAEDSALLRELVMDTLAVAGYKKILTYNNGQEAWDALQALKAKGPIEDQVQILITDIEMPQMDGHRLIKLVKTDEKLKKLPAIIFSSLINEEMRRKGELLGADGQITKPEIGQLIAIIDEKIL
ncbi:MAG: chemotaxis protein [Veillonellales bacterium]